MFNTYNYHAVHCERCAMTVLCCVGCILRRLFLHWSICTTMALCTVISNQTSTCVCWTVQFWFCSTVSIYFSLLQFVVTLCGMHWKLLLLFNSVTALFFLTAVFWSHWWVTSSLRTSACQRWDLWTVRALTTYCSILDTEWQLVCRFQSCWH